MQIIQTCLQLEKPRFICSWILQVPFKKPEEKFNKSPRPEFWRIYLFKSCGFVLQVKAGCPCSADLQKSGNSAWRTEPTRIKAENTQFQTPLCMSELRHASPSSLAQEGPHCIPCLSPSRAWHHRPARGWAGPLSPAQWAWRMNGKLSPVWS